MHEELSKLDVYRTRALECRKLAEIAGPGTRARYWKLAEAYDLLAKELERLATATPSGVGPPDVQGSAILG
jgi:hypothetical protein